MVRRRLLSRRAGGSQSVAEPPQSAASAGEPPGGGAPPGGALPNDVPPGGLLGAHALPANSGSHRFKPLRSRGATPGECGRLAPLYSFVAALAVCALAVCALFVPGLAFGAESTPSSGSPYLPAPEAAANQHQAIEGVSPTGPSTGTLLVTLPWGSGAGEVGLEQPTEGLNRGPEALAVAPDGRLAVLDSVNKRLVILDAHGEHTQSLPLPLAEPRFLAVDDSRLYVLDCDNDRLLLTLDWRGSELGAAALPELTDVVTGLFATTGGPCVEVAHESTFLISEATGAATDDTPIASAADGTTTSVDSPATPLTSEEPTSLGAQAKPNLASLHSLAGRPLDSDLGRAAKVTFKPGKGVQIKMFKIDKKNLKPTKTGDATPTLGRGRILEHLVSVDGDGDNGLIVGARLLEPTSGENGRAALLLTRLANLPSRAPGSPGSGELANATGTLLLAESPFAYLGQPYVIAPDGRIFQPVGNEAGYSILIHEFGETKTSRGAQGARP